jgi:hypothetical protein
MFLWLWQHSWLPSSRSYVASNTAAVQHGQQYRPMLRHAAATAGSQKTTEQHKGCT